jgi:hypothetical protein
MHTPSAGNAHCTLLESKLQSMSSMSQVFVEKFTCGKMALEKNVKTDHRVLPPFLFPS